MTQAPICNDSRQIRLAVDEVLAFNRRPLTITCLSGVVWLTDGVGGECIIHSGQQLTVASKGKVCIQALVPSKVWVYMRSPMTGAMPLAVTAPAG